MKQYYACFLLIAAFLGACNSNNKPVDPKLSKPASPGGITVLKSFSDSLKVDTFKVVLTGDAPKNMMIKFSITAFNGVKIYEKDLKATDLIQNYQSTLDLEKDSKQKDFVLQEYNLFFEDENFLEPAVTENETPDANTPDKTFFQELKLSGLNGFKYRTGNDNKVYIAWSAKEKKVLPYYSCCK